MTTGWIVAVVVGGLGLGLWGWERARNRRLDAADKTATIERRIDLAARAIAAHHISYQDNTDPDQNWVELGKEVRDWYREQAATVLEAAGISTIRQQQDG